MNLYYLTAMAIRRQLPRRALPSRASSPARCYHDNEMRPQTIGRVLGIGLRVGSRVVGERLTAAAQPSAPSAAVPQSAAPRPSIHAAARQTGSLTRALGGFFRPFRRAGSIVWLQVTGVFFLLPVIVFAPTLWRTRMSYATGPDHRIFLSAAVVVSVFLYLGVTSFLRARKK